MVVRRCARPTIFDGQIIDVVQELSIVVGDRFVCIEKHAMLENLAPGATYELVVKAGNSNGTSQLTSPLKFVMAKNYIVQTTNQVRRWT